MVDPQYKESIEQELRKQYLTQFPEYETTFGIYWVEAR